MAVPKVYDPWNEMRNIQRDMDEIFASFLERGGGRELASWGLRAPLTDIEDRGDSLLLTLELPGMRREDVRVSLDKDSVSVSAERKDVSGERKKDYYYCERSYSGYKRSFALPAEVDPDSADAECKDGVLILSLKKVRSGGQKKEVKVK